jgi:hypothetical protein
LKKIIRQCYQQDIFDESVQRLLTLTGECFNTIELLLMQILIKAIEDQSVTPTLEENNASQN